MASGEETFNNKFNINIVFNCSIWFKTGLKKN